MCEFPHPFPPLFSSPHPHTPPREVFEDTDGEIKRLEDEAAADPSHKIDLIKHLHVSVESGDIHKCEYM